MRPATTALAILAIALTAQCSFRFDNPVEQCPPQGCFRDAGQPMSSADAGQTANDGGVLLAVKPGWSLELVTDKCPGDSETAWGYYYPSLAVGADDQPFAAFTCGNGDMNGYLHAAFREASQWTVGFTGVVDADFKYQAFGDDKQPQACGSWTLTEQSEDKWLTYDLSLGSSCGFGAWPWSSMRAWPGLGGTVNVLDVCGGTAYHGVWDGDRSSEVQVGWEDVAQINGTLAAWTIDSGGQGHFLFFDSDAKQLVYLQQAQPQWTQEVLRSDFGGAAWPVLAWPVLDPQGQLAYCWQDLGESALPNSVTAGCSRRVAGEWSDKNVVVNETDFMIDAVIMNGQGQFELVVDKHTYSQDSSSEFSDSAQYWTETADGWESSEIAVTQNVDIVFSNIALDHEGAPRLLMGAPRSPSGSEKRLYYVHRAP